MFLGEKRYPHARLRGIRTIHTYIYICDRLQENQAQRGVRKYREKIDQFLKNVLFQADGRERLGLL